MNSAHAISPDLAQFLEEEGFTEIWDRFRQETKDPQSLNKRFTEWFDGFKTLKLIHHLRQNSYPEQDMFPSIAKILELSDLNPGFDPRPIRPHDLPAQIRLVQYLRKLKVAED